METDELKRNIDAAVARIIGASARAGSSVTLVAATKTVPPQIINAAIGMGITEIGENRVNEFLDKRDAVKGANWHFIGTLQRNKAKYLVGSTALIQSVSNAPLALEIDRLAAKRGIVQRVLAEVNIGDEASKTGASTDGIDELIELVRSCRNLELDGLMAIPPKGAPDSVYKRLYDIYEKHKGGTFGVLSVGMSGDYERAIANGSNMVRLGTAIFGSRG